jgi:hypothetical protein
MKASGICFNKSIFQFNIFHLAKHVLLWSCLHNSFYFVWTKSVRSKVTAALFCVIWWAILCPNLSLPVRFNN